MRRAAQSAYYPAGAEERITILLHPGSKFGADPTIPYLTPLLNPFLSPGLFKLGSFHFKCT